MQPSNADGDAAERPGEVERPEVRRVDVGGERAGERLDRFLMDLLPGVPKSRIYRLVRKGEVRVNGKRAAPEQRLRASDVVRVPPVRLEAGPERAPARAPAGVLHEDERVLVLDKPARIAVHGGVGVDTAVLDALRAERPGAYLELAHRLDRDTSGCLLVAKSPQARRELFALLKQGRVEKRYAALVAGVFEHGEQRVAAPLRTDVRKGGERTVKVGSGGLPAVSEFRPERTFGRRATLVEVRIETGRMHQIRVHAAYAGHPVAGDARYGDARFNAELRALGLKRMFLHARSLSLPWGGGQLRVTAPLPEELRAVLERLASEG